MDSLSRTLTNIWSARIKKVIVHFCLPWRDPYFQALIKNSPWGWSLAILHYVFELPLLMLDACGFPEGFSFLQSLFKKHSRALNEQEFEIARFLFENRIDLKKVRIDENSILGTQNGKYAYVSYYYINSKGRLTTPVLMHELVHVLQYVQFGSPYIFRNMMAHWSKDKYDYGGLSRLEKILHTPHAIHHLNFEQRADIVSDYFLIAMRCNPEWGKATHQDVDTYLRVIDLILKA